MNTDLTDAEWALVADLFERQGAARRPSTPASAWSMRAATCPYGRRLALAAQELSALARVYKAFCRWAAAGTFEAMHDRLRAVARPRGPQPRADCGHHRRAEHAAPPRAA
jgi:putative transposase